ncbi:MAG: hypothetical protein AAB520_02605, partial [Patescibacteria group bacterium]
MLFAIFYFLFAIAPVHAQSQSSTVNVLNTNPDVEKNLHNVTQIVMMETMSAMMCQLTGRDPLSPNQKCLGVDPETGKIGFVGNGGGMISVMGTLISYTFVPPVSSTQYISYLKNNFGLIKPIYAQTSAECKGPGMGFCGLKPVILLWATMRNFAYLIFILLFVVLGLAIMLRIHIDPRTVMTVQNQIPKIIVGLLLVTFSFSIAGLLVDTMYVASYLLGSVIASADVDRGQQDFRKIVTASNTFDAANKSYTGGVFGIVTDGSQTIHGLVNNLFLGPKPEDNFANKFGNVEGVGGPLVGILSTFIEVLANIIIGIAVIYILIKLWIILVLSYINILLDVIFAPFWFLLGLLPGSEMGIGGWFKDMLANLAVYPATIAMLMLANVFLHALRGADGALFVPPVLGNAHSANEISGLIGLGFFFMLPNVLQIMKGAFKAPKIDLGPVFAPAGEAVGT